MKNIITKIKNSIDGCNSNETGLKRGLFNWKIGQRKYQETETSPKVENIQKEPRRNKEKSKMH